MSSRELLVGIDWSKEKHDVAILDADRKLLDQFTIPHGVSGLEELHRRIAMRCLDRAAVHVAIETPHGALVAACLLAGHAVFTLNPKQLDRFRDRFSPSGAKDDRRDALVLASALGSDPELFQAVSARSTEIVMLERLLKLHDELVEQASVQLNRARELLHEYFPEFEPAVGEIDSVWCWEVWQLAKSRADREHLTEARLAQVLKRRHVQATTAKELLALLKAAAMPSLPGVEAANVMHLDALLSQIELNKKQTRAVDHAIDEHLEIFKNQKDDHGVSDADLILSMPGAGSYVTAVLLTEAADEVGTRDYQRLRMVAGVAPVTIGSGKKRAVVMRRACRERLRNGVYHLARVAMMNDPHSRKRYVDLRTRGINHAAALRTLADGLLRSMMAMLRSRQPWKPKSERNAQPNSA